MINVNTPNKAKSDDGISPERNPRRKQKVWVLSDLHQRGVSPPWLPTTIPDHDICILAGDIHVSIQEAIAFGEQLTLQPTVLVVGNHEF
ncbi:hypothetical protein ACFQ14_03235 [Pseudahrensia aquimaris]|uniref:Calcineurin-like phosphoesterase domain-containing protein n=1 Tax=Pseudahrensia aquimaris TaxID=744461 RepID=A0ABW3FC34_9HYPH